MKLHEMHNVDILWEGELDGESYVLFSRLEEGVMQMGFAQNTRGGVVTGVAKGALKFISNPVVAALAAGYAVNAFQTYQKNKRLTTQFYARDTQERKLYQDIVDTLMKTGRYRKVKEKYVDGGYMWVLKKVQ